MIRSKITRYGTDDIVEYDSSKMFEIKDKIDTAPCGDDIRYTVQGGDDLRSIAFALYSDARLYWIIAEYNDIIDPFQALPTGKKLRAPSTRRVLEEFF